MVHFVKVRGTGAKVFKVAQVALGPGETVSLGKTVSLAIHTTRMPRPGKHVVEVMLNGERRPLGAFVLKA